MTGFKRLISAAMARDLAAFVRKLLVLANTLVKEDREWAEIRA